MQRLEPLSGHVGVDGGGRDVGMAQQHLHCAQIGPVVEQVRGEGVPQGVRGQWRGDACLNGIALDQAPEHHPRHGRARLDTAGGDKQVCGLALSQHGRSRPRHVAL